jgi:5-methyltetrahydrofolate--homocysteine methyltransferase
VTASTRTWTSALEKYAPLEIINGPLMKGMDEVGRLFGANELIVAEVLQSAESMKAAVSYLEPRMSKAQAAARGKVVLATVKGDVHDIGKNLVENHPRQQRLPRGEPGHQGACPSSS